MSNQAVVGITPRSLNQTTTRKIIEANYELACETNERVLSNSKHWFTTSFRLEESEAWSVRTIVSLPVWPSGRRLSGKQRDLGSIPFRFSPFFKTCGLGIQFYNKESVSKAVSIQT